MNVTNPVLKQAVSNRSNTIVYKTKKRQLRGYPGRRRAVQAITVEVTDGSRTGLLPAWPNIGIINNSKVAMAVVILIIEECQDLFAVSWQQIIGSEPFFIIKHSALISHIILHYAEVCFFGFKTDAPALRRRSIAR